MQPKKPLRTKHTENIYKVITYDTYSGDEDELGSPSR